MPSSGNLILYVKDSPGLTSFCVTSGTPSNLFSSRTPCEWIVVSTSVLLVKLSVTPAPCSALIMGPGIIPLYASILTALLPIVFFTIEAVRLYESPFLSSTTSDDLASGRPVMSVEKLPANTLVLVSDCCRKIIPPTTTTTATIPIINLFFIDIVLVNYNSRLRRSTALKATITVLVDISTAANAGSKSIPFQARAPAARGRANIL